jgi:hypothetical protein
MADETLITEGRLLGQGAAASNCRLKSKSAAESRRILRVGSLETAVPWYSGRPQFINYPKSGELNLLPW